MCVLNQQISMNTVNNGKKNKKNNTVNVFTIQKDIVHMSNKANIKFTLRTTILKIQVDIQED